MSLTGLLHPFPIPFDVWEDILFEFISGLPKVLELIQYWSWLPLDTHILLMMWQQFYKGDCYPCTFVFDRDRLFLSNFLTKTFKFPSTTLKFHLTYHA